MPTDDELESWKEDAHNQGQADGAEGKFDAPYGSFLDRTVFNRDWQDEVHDSYREGHDNGSANRSKD